MVLISYLIKQPKSIVEESFAIFQQKIKVIKEFIASLILK